ncbi:MAPEG family protein [Solimonas sp. K1W22B-7]|uniref:MAPEG family protein n=1 Tax=Solimonas sp. K1W22B-7 TaxID=2303331 RepID=UPI001969972F|nr:MAPEG family protein [Solimonas sp. K1W22B-7]
METPLHWYALSAVVLFLKMFGISLYQGYCRIGRQQFKNPEDAAFVHRAPATEELPQVQRAARAWLNDVENIPIFLALGIAYVQLGLSAAAAPWLFGLFTLARIAHTLCYLAGLQPWRTVAYSVGIGSTLWMSAMILGAVL